MPSDDDIALVDRTRLRWDPNDPDTLLGEGSFGVVHRGRLNGTPVAIKVVKRPPPAEHASEEDKLREHAALKQHRREIHRFKVVQNPYIIQYLSVFRGEHPRDLYIVTEFLEGGSLHDSLSKMRARRAILDERSFLQVATHIARGLNHVHASQYTHGDMKPQNILLTSSFQFHEDENAAIIASIPASAKVKIADFGLSKRLDGAESASIFGSTTATTDFGTGPCGTYLYMSPEAYEGVSKLSDSQAKAADVYAFGLVLFELLSGLQSWGLERVRNPMQLSAFVRSGKRPAWGHREDQLDPSYIDLVSRCWSQNPEHRPTVDEIVVVLEEQQDAFDQRVAQIVKCPSSQAFSDVTKFDAVSPECEDQKAGDNVLPIQLEDPFANDGRPQQVDDPSDPYPDVPTKQRPNTPIQDIECKRIDTEVIAEDFAHTVEEGEDIFASRESEESGPPSIRPVISVRLTHTEIEMYRSKQSQDAIVPPDPASASEDSESDSNSSVEEEDESDKEIEDDEGAVPNEVSDMHATNGMEALLSQENPDSRFMDSITGPHRVQKVTSVMITQPDVQPLSLPQHERPVLGMGSVAGQQNGLTGMNARSDSAMLQSFMGVPLAAMGTTTDDKVKTQQQTDSNIQYSGQVSGNSEAISSAMQGLNMGPAQAPPLPPPPAEPMEEAKEGISSMPSNPKTPEETEAANAAAQQLRAKMYSSPNVEDGEFNSFSENMDFPNSGFAPPTVESKSLESWSLSQQPLQNGLPRPSQPHPTHVVAGPGLQGFPNGTTTQSVDYGNSNAMAQRVYTHQPNPYVSLTSQGASAPPLSDTSQSAVGRVASQGQHHLPSKAPPPVWTPSRSFYKPQDSLHRPPGMNLNPNISSCGHSVDNSAVLSALQRPDAIVVLRDWWNRGYRQAVASGLARAPGIGGEELLDMVREFTSWNNQKGPRDPVVAKDLCAAIGHIARNSSKPLSAVAITRSVGEVLSVLPSFQSMVRQRNEVYSFANFALCNLFKVYNAVPDYQLRMMIASWITYSISWNVAREDNGPFDEVLAYTATSAARNFMWMNEQNVAAFVSCNSNKPYRSPSAPMTLIASMKYFDWTGSLSVVEASLSALAMIIHFPRQRAEFMTARGAEAVIEVLNKHASNSEITSLAFWMVTVLFSGPPNMHSHEEIEALRRAFAEQDGCQKFVAALNQVGRLAQCEKQKVESLEKGFNALLTVARFGGGILRAHLIDAGCMPMILNATRQLASLPITQYPNEDASVVKARGRLGVVLCELIGEVSNEHKGMSYMRDNNVKHPLQNMMQIHRADDGFTSCCRVALTKLAY